MAWTEGQRGTEKDNVVRGSERAHGEGGFWARITAQDSVYPDRYAFQQQARCIEPRAGRQVKFIDNSDIFAANGLPLTEGSVVGSAVIHTIAGTTTLPTNRVANWAAEVNGNGNVPIGAIVWMRPGEMYTEGEFSTIRDDFTFEHWSGLADFVLTGSATVTVDNFPVTFTANAGIANPAIIVDAGDVTKLLINKVGTYVFSGYLDIFDNGGIDVVPRTIRGQLYVNGAAPTPFATLFVGNGANAQITVATCVIIETADLTGGPSSDSAEITLTIDLPVTYSPVNLRCNDGELIVEQK